MGYSLIDQHPCLSQRMPRDVFTRGVSPVAWLPNLSRELGLDVWVKDDSRHGQPYGGNKARKLELILADARRVGADSVVTFGATRSHHALATAIYARLAGVHAMLVVTDSFGNDPDGTHVARLRDLGATVLQTRTLVGAVLRTLAVTLLPRGARPYVIPPGASMPLGTLGYVNAGLELAAQVAAGELPEPARIYVALGSGGTTAGLLLGLRLAGLRSQLCPVMVTRMGGRTAGLWVSWLANRAVDSDGLPKPSRLTGWHWIWHVRNLKFGS